MHIIQPCMHVHIPNHACKDEKKDTRRRGIRRRESRPDTSVGAVADEDQKKIH